jgi:hypothetical protein
MYRRNRLMRRLKLVLGVAALMMAMMAVSAAPAAAQNIVCEDFDGDFICDFDDFDNDFFDGNGDVEQEAESGDIDQSFEVTGGGDNSNQCVGVQGVANTGNAQNTLGVTDFGDFNNDDGDRFFDNNGDDGDRFFGDRFFDNNGGFEIDDGGADIDVSGSSDTSCDQQVNQAASASG